MNFEVVYNLDCWQAFGKEVWTLQSTGGGAEGGHQEWPGASVKAEGWSSSVRRRRTRCVEEAAELLLAVASLGGLVHKPHNWEVSEVCLRQH